jgi:hypothetical protein
MLPNPLLQTSASMLLLKAMQPTLQSKVETCYNVKQDQAESLCDTWSYPVAR